MSNEANKPKPLDDDVLALNGLFCQVWWGHPFTPPQPWHKLANGNPDWAAKHPDWSYAGRMMEQHFERAFVVYFWHKVGEGEGEMTKVFGAYPFSLLPTYRGYGLSEESWQVIRQMALDATARFQKREEYSLKGVAYLENGDLVSYVTKILDSKVKQEGPTTFINGVPTSGPPMTEEQVEKVQKREIANTIVGLVRNNALKVENQESMGIVLDRDIRKAYDEMTKGRDIPPIKQKKFYMLMEELSFDWVRDKYTHKPVKKGHDCKVLSAFDKKGRPIADLVRELTEKYGFDGGRGTDHSPPPTVGGDAAGKNVKNDSRFQVSNQVEEGDRSD